MLKPLLIATCIIFIATAGCSKKRPAPPASAPATQSQAAGIDERRALEIAKKAVADQENWGDRATYDARRKDDGWAVNVWRGNRAAGGRRTVIIDKDGKVIEYVKLD